MNPPTLKIQKLHPDAKIPVFATEGAACFDLHAMIPSGLNTLVSKNFHRTLRTGLAFEIPPGWAMLIFSRSGHGFMRDIRLANCVGVIDSDYRGEVMVKLVCDKVGSELVIECGDRIAQAMLIQVPRPALEAVEELSSTERGAGGFGSTGVK